MNLNSYGGLCSSRRYTIIPLTYSKTAKAVRPQRFYIRYKEGIQFVPGDIESLALVMTKENYKERVALT